MEGLLARKDFSLSLFKTFVAEVLDTVKSIDDTNELIAFCEDKIKELTNADSTYMIRYDKNEKSYRIPSLGKTHTLCKDKDTLFQKVIATKQPLLLKELKKSLLYKETCDNLESQPQKEVALIPLTFQKTVRSKPEVLVWCAIAEDSAYEFTQKTILYLVKFLEALKPVLLQLDADSSEQQKMTLMQCLESNEMLERQIKRNEQYFHSIIHDIRTPMNALMGFLELLSINEKDETKREYLDSAVKSGEHMVRLISDALDMAKIASGHLAVTKKPFHPIEEIADIVKIFYETARKKKIVLSAFLDPSMPREMVSDIYRIKQVLSNLLSNAVKFTPQGGSIWVGMYYSPDDDTLTVEVKDSGVGISKEAQEAIFLPYRQEKSTTEEEYGGTGLGLSISQQIVVLLGGKLELESQEGKGSRFYFTLPANTTKANEPAFDVEAVKDRRVLMYRWEGRSDIRADALRRYMQAFEAKVTEGKQEQTLSEWVEKQQHFDVLLVEAKQLEAEDFEWIQVLLDQGKTVLFLEDMFDDRHKWFSGSIHQVAYPALPGALYKGLGFEISKETTKQTDKIKRFTGQKALVVDDNRINLKFMKEVLKRFEMDATLCEDAECGLEKLQQEHYDIVFMDENMPKMTGSEAIAMIRKMEKKTGKKHRLVSLSGDSEHYERIKNAGADAILTKPVQLALLTETLQALLLTDDINT